MTNIDKVNGIIKNAEEHIDIAGKNGSQGGQQMVHTLSAYVAIFKILRNDPTNADTIARLALSLGIT